MKRIKISNFFQERIHISNFTATDDTDVNYLSGHVLMVGVHPVVVVVVGGGVDGVEPPVLLGEVGDLLLQAQQLPALVPCSIITHVTTIDCGLRWTTMSS